MNNSSFYYSLFFKFSLMQSQSSNAKGIGREFKARLRNFTPNTNDE